MLPGARAGLMAGLLDTERADARADRAGRGQQILVTLLSHGWSLSRLAVALNVSRETVARWRRGVAPTAHALGALEDLAAAAGLERPAEPDGADDDPVVLCDRRWRRVYDRLRQQRDVLLMLCLDWEQRLWTLEQRLGLGTPRTPALDALNAARLAEAMPARTMGG